MNPNTRRTLIRFGAALVFLTIVVFLMRALESVATVLLVAFFIAYILDPAVRRLNAWGLNRSAAAAVIMVLGLASIVALILLVVPAIVGELAAFSRQAPQYLSALGSLTLLVLERLDVAVPQNWNDVTDLVGQQWRQYLPRVADLTGRVVSTLFGSVFKSALSILASLIQLALVPVIAYYLLASFDKIQRGIIDLIPPYTRQPILGKLREIDLVLAGFVRGQLTVATVLGVLYSVGFLMIGLDIAIVLGIISGVLWLVPYLGTLVALVSGSVVAYAKFGDAQHVMYVIAWVGAVQVLEGYVLTPRIVGEAVGLHPVVYILALISGATLFGFVGMLTAIPVTAVLKVLLVTAVEAYQKSYLYLDDHPDEH